ncbi:energy transducer TonB [Pseudomonas sp. GD03944]|uniref:energy transducer TonB n=1 Tax=Pseudomonas sp. GD03944 TaxID=2975409 RepID=UPI002447601B|nr:energy transducer TonB [Pseudomonas sp. GD03944]MDH1265311.1 energy transducer TonB [Pseudomonas sp. GD03944]
MIPELRRRAYLGAMQVASWLPRTVLPFAAPSRPALLAPPAPEPEVETAIETELAPAVARESAPVPVQVPSERPKIEVPRPTQTSRLAKPEPQDEPVEAQAPREAPVAPPRFSLQLLRAGACVLLVELPTGEPLQSRDPAYLLLKDLLRAAGLPDSPQLIGEPVRWPLLVRGNMDQGPQAALEFLQSFIAARLEEQEPCACLWLVGLPAIRFAGDADADAYNRELQVEDLGAAWAVPGLELLMDEPERKAALWDAMRRVRQRWSSPV